MKNCYTSLMWHQVSIPPRDKYYVEPTRFKTQIDFLDKYGVSSYVLGSESYLTKSCLLTFDDGHRSNLWAAEYLQEKGMTGYFYVVKDFSLNDSDYLNEAEIRKIFAMGHKVGVHGKNHEWWTKKSTKTLVNELRETKDWIENITGEKCVSCSAVGGFIDDRVIAAINDNIPDLQWIRTSKPGINYINDTILKSFAVHSSSSPEWVAKIANHNQIVIDQELTVWYVKEILKPIYFGVKRYL